MYFFQELAISAKVISYINFKSIEIEPFLADLRVSSLVMDPPDDVDYLVDLYDSTLGDIVDEHSTLRTKEMTRRPLLPWYNKNTQAAKRHRRYCDRLWIRTGKCAFKKKQRTVFSVLNKVLPKRISFQILSTEIKIWPIILRTSSVTQY